MIVPFDCQVILETFESEHYYGKFVEVVLPSVVKPIEQRSLFDYRLIIADEYYSPVPYVVAEYKLYDEINPGIFLYQFTGVKIK